MLLLIPIFCIYASAESATKTMMLLGGHDVPQLPADYGKLTDAVNEKMTAGRYKPIIAFGTKTFGPSQVFTLDNARRKIAQAEQAVRDGKPGDQIIVVVETHGAPPSAGGLHHVLVSNQTTLDLGELKKLQSAARERGVKLAIMDLTCYSGQSLKFADLDPGTCVITASSASMVAWADFGALLFQKIQPGKSLEQAFLEARRDSTFGFPQISSAGNRAAAKTLDVVQRTATPYGVDLKTSIEGPVEESCPTGFAAHLDDLAAVLRATPGVTDVEANLLRNELTRYDRRGREILSPFANSEIDVAGVRVKMQELAEIEKIDFYIHFYNDTSPRSQAIQDHIDQLTLERDRLEKTDPRFKALRDRSKQLAEAPEEIYTKADAVGKAERQVYDKLYARGAAASAGKNPCADFKF